MKINKEISYGLLLDEINKITESLSKKYNPEQINKIKNILLIEDYNFLNKNNNDSNIFLRINYLLEKIIFLTIQHKDEPNLLVFSKIYCKNTNFFLEKILPETSNKKDGGNYQREFVNSITFYKHFIDRIIKENILSKELMDIIQNIENHFIRNKLLINWFYNTRFILKYEKEDNKEIKSKLNRIDESILNKQDIANAELFSTLKSLFRSTIRNEKEIYARILIDNLRQIFFRELRSENKAGLIEQIFEIHSEYIQICIEEESTLAFTLFYTFRDMLDKIYDPNKKDLDDATLIVTEYLNLYKKYFDYGFRFLISSESSREYKEKIFKGVISFYKDSRVFDEYKKIEPLLLSKLFYVLSCYCFENNYFEYIDIVFDNSISKPKEYVLVNEKPIISNELIDLIDLLANAEYKTMDSENVKSSYFLLSLMKLRKITKLKEFKDLFDKLKVQNPDDIKRMQIIMLHKRNFETLEKRSKEIDEKFKQIIKTKLPSISKFTKELIKISDSFDSKIEEKDRLKDLSSEKINGYIEKFFKTYEKTTEIKEIAIKDTSKKKFNYLFNKTKHDKIWLVDVSGTTAYATDSIGSDLGSDLARYESYLIAEELNKNKNIYEITNHDFENIFKEKNISLGDSEYILLCPFKFNSRIRHLIKYEYSDKGSKEFIQLANKKIFIYHYIDRSNISKAFLYPKKSVKYKVELFNFKPIDDFEEIKNKPFEIKFKTLKNISDDDVDKKHISEKDVVIQTKYGYFIDVNKDEIISFTY